MKKALAIGAASLCALGFAGSVFATDITTQGDTIIEAEYTVTSSYKVTIPSGITFNGFEDTQSASVTASNVLIHNGETLKVSMKSANGALINGESSSIPYSVAYILGETSVEEDVSSEKTYELLNVEAGADAEDEFVTDITFTSGTKDNVRLAGKHADTLTFKIAVNGPAYMQDLADNTKTDSIKQDIADGKIASLVDNRDNKEYTVAKIGDKIWMTQNLAYTANDDNSTWDDGILAQDGEVYYNWNAANAKDASDDTKSTCPKGWILPTQTDFENLIDGHDSSWITGDPFNGVFAGSVYEGTINSIGDIGYYWASTEAEESAVFLTFNSDYVQVWGDVKSGGIAVRCIAE